MISHYSVCILALLTEMEDLRMTQNEVAELIGVTRRTLNNWLRDGKFPDCCVRIMGRRMPGTFDREKVEAWIRENVK
ncbi:excisionase and transcriptional regulator [Salmonella phage SeF1]|nr:excisionase and transcriptional regulator [Salmonella phage SeF1]